MNAQAHSVLAAGGLAKDPIWLHDEARSDNLVEAFVQEHRAILLQHNLRSHYSCALVFCQQFNL